MSEQAQEIAPQEPTGEVIGFLQVIDKAASNPDVDAEKLHRILDAQERVLERNARMAFNRDLAEVSGELPTITERGAIEHSGKVISRYARWDEDINPVIKPILARYGFNLRFRTGRAEDGSLAVTAVLAHREGHSEETTIYLPADDSGAKNRVQAVGSSTSYGKRYTASALLNLTTGGQDDDGQAAGATEKISEEQVTEIESRIDALVESGKMAESKPFFDWLRREFKVSDIAELNQQGYEAVCAQLAKKEKGKASKKKAAAKEGE